MLKRPASNIHIILYAALEPVARKDYVVAL